MAVRQSGLPCGALRYRPALTPGTSRLRIVRDRDLRRTRRVVGNAVEFRVVRALHIDDARPADRRMAAGIEMNIDEGAVGFVVIVHRGAGRAVGVAADLDVVGVDAVVVLVRETRVSADFRMPEVAAAVAEALLLDDPLQRLCGAGRRAAATATADGGRGIAGIRVVDRAQLLQLCACGTRRRHQRCSETRDENQSRISNMRFHLLSCG